MGPSLTILGLISTLHIITGLAGGFGYAAVFGLIAASANEKRGITTGSLAALGKRSLTFYLLLETMLVIIFSPLAFGLGETLNTTGASVIALLIWLISVGIAAVLERMGLRGPAEVLLRRLVYHRRQRVS